MRTSQEQHILDAESFLWNPEYEGREGYKEFLSVMSDILGTHAYFEDKADTQEAKDIHHEMGLVLNEAIMFSKGIKHNDEGYSTADTTLSLITGYNLSMRRTIRDIESSNKGRQLSDFDKNYSDKLYSNTKSAESALDFVRSFVSGTE